MLAAMELARLDADALAEELSKIARDAWAFADQGSVLELSECLQRVRAAAAEASGVALALLEVAESFLKALARSDMGRTEIALRRFVVHQPESYPLLKTLAEGHSVARDELDALGPLAAELVDSGALRASHGRLDLRPSLRTLALDLLEPAVFRMWRQVDRARGLAGLARMDTNEQGAYLAGEFGVTVDQAQRYLRRSPIACESRNPRVTEVLPAVTGFGGEPAHVLYRRETTEPSQHVFDQTLWILSTVQSPGLRTIVTSSSAGTQAEQGGSSPAISEGMSGKVTAWT